MDVLLHEDANSSLFFKYIDSIFSIFQGKCKLDLQEFLDKITSNITYLYFSMYVLICYPLQKKLPKASGTQKWRNFIKAKNLLRGFSSRTCCNDSRIQTLELEFFFILSSSPHTASIIIIAAHILSPLVL